jgi:hypothetical protein
MQILRELVSFALTALLVVLLIPAYLLFGLALGLMEWWKDLGTAFNER